MKDVSVEEGIKKIDEYVNNQKPYPFFVAVDGSKEYKQIKSHYSTYTEIRTSDFCQENSFADEDKLCEEIRNGNEYRLLLGLGDYISLSKRKELLGRIKDINLKGKLIVLCRGIRLQIDELRASDSKFVSSKYCLVESRLDYSVIRVNPEVSIPAEKNFKSFLHTLEDGEAGKLYVKTALDFYSEDVINSDYEAIKDKNPDFLLPETALSKEQWAEYVKDDKTKDYELTHWRTFLELKLHSPKNKYLQLVICRADKYPIYKDRVFDALLDKEKSDSDFWTLYDERKNLLNKLEKKSISNYLSRSNNKGADKVYYLTDNTEKERYAIIEEICKYGKIPLELDRIYPALADYLSDYIFYGLKDATKYTEYFETYKRQKVTNKVEDNFLKGVNDLAKDRIYPYLETRGSLVEKLNDGTRKLYWIDALGVEYLGYIQVKAKALELSVSVEIGRAVLPSLTCFNKDFYESWNGEKESIKKLDEIKHKGDKPLFNYEKTKLPIHLAAELKIIDEVLEQAKEDLSQGSITSIVIASDHGASRLAVINEQENKLKMHTEGKHSGRCCPINEINETPETATEENNFWVLANYDRFKGGRKASVEVHGGATLEEIVVPIIELTLADKTLEVSISPTEGGSSSDQPVVFLGQEVTEIPIYITQWRENVRIEIDGRSFPAELQEDGYHKYVARIKKSEHKLKEKEYEVKVYAGQNLLKTLPVKLKNKAENTGFSNNDMGI